MDDHLRHSLYQEIRRKTQRDGYSHVFGQGGKCGGLRAAVRHRDLHAVEHAARRGFCGGIWSGRLWDTGSRR